MFGFLKTAFMFSFGWLNPKRLLVALAKKAADEIIQKYGDRLQEKVNELYREGSTKFIDRLFDSWQSEIIGGIDKIPLVPKVIRRKMKSIAQVDGDALQRAVLKAATEKGGPGIDAVFDSAQAVILAKIRQL